MTTQRHATVYLVFSFAYKIDYRCVCAVTKEERICISEDAGEEEKKRKTP